MLGSNHLVDRRNSAIGDFWQKKILPWEFLHSCLGLSLVLKHPMTKRRRFSERKSGNARAVCNPVIPSIIGTEVLGVPEHNRGNKVPLFIVNFDARDGTVFDTNTVFLHLAKLVQGDGELGMNVDPLSPSVSLIDYKTPATSGFCQTIIRELANGSFPNKNIFIHGVTSNYLVQIKDIQRWHPITEFGGIVMFDPLTTLKAVEARPYETFDLHVVYDVQECNGEGYICLDNSLANIGLPIEIILLHELSHVYHYCKRDFNFSSPELQAEIDENTARRQLGYVERNQNDHFGACRGQAAGGKTFWDDCFIVSAAYGSFRSAEVRTLQNSPRSGAAHEPYLLGVLRAVLRRLLSLQPARRRGNESKSFSRAACAGRYC